MARNRMIKPEFWEDSGVAKLKPITRLFYISLWNFADDKGYIKHDEAWLKAKCLPYDRVTISSLLQELVANCKCSIKNGVIFIPAFANHQRIDHPQASDLYMKYAQNSRQEQECSANVPESHPSNKKLKRREEEREVKENIAKGEPSRSAQNEGICEKIEKSKELQPHQEFVEGFKSLYETKSGEKYLVKKLDFVHSADLIRQFGYEQVVKKAKILACLCEQARGSPKPLAWFCSGGWSDFTIGKLKSHWNNIVSELLVDKKEVLKKQEDEEFLKNLVKRGVMPDVQNASVMESG